MHRAASSPFLWWMVEQAMYMLLSLFHLTGKEGLVLAPGTAVCTLLGGPLRWKREKEVKKRRNEKKKKPKQAAASVRWLYQGSIITFDTKMWVVMSFCHKIVNHLYRNRRKIKGIEKERHSTESKKRNKALCYTQTLHRQDFLSYVYIDERPNHSSLYSVLKQTNKRWCC